MSFCGIRQNSLNIKCLTVPRFEQASEQFTFELMFFFFTDDDSDGDLVTDFLSSNGGGGGETVANGNKNGLRKSVDGNLIDISTNNDGADVPPQALNSNLLKQNNQMPKFLHNFNRPTEPGNNQQNPHPPHTIPAINTPPMINNHSTMVPTISVTPHSPGAKYNSILGM